MLSRLNELEQEIGSFVISGEDELEQFRIKYLSRKGVISRLFDELKNVSKDEKPAVGKKLNEVKKLAEKKFEDSKLEFEKSGKEQEDIDLTLPGRTFSVGREHIIIKT
jgi:phenylalanyl-tRNA synthetase alpha chain